LVKVWAGLIVVIPYRASFFESLVDEEDLGVAVKDPPTATRWQLRLFVPRLAVVIPYRASLLTADALVIRNEDYIEERFAEEIW
jgi:hypothetical protein